jgi:hypothetical protein
VGVDAQREERSVQSFEEWCDGIEQSEAYKSMRCEHGYESEFEFESEMHSLQCWKSGSDGFDSIEAQRDDKELMRLFETWGQF